MNYLACKSDGNTSRRITTQGDVLISKRIEESVIRNQAIKILNAYRDYKKKLNEKKHKAKGIALIRDNSFSIIVDGPLQEIEDNHETKGKRKEKDDINDENAVFSFNKNNSAFNRSVHSNNNDNSNSNQIKRNKSHHLNEYLLFEHHQENTTNINEQENVANQKITNEDIMNILGMNEDSSKKERNDEERESSDDDQLSY